jgi:endonuclease/exonuclease/phosphatase family metal-dependent hydrolase
MAAAMTVRLASFNVENFFARPNALNVLDWDEGQPILAAYAEFNALIQKAVYAPADKARMIELLLLLDVYRAKNGIVHRNRVVTPRWAWLRANRGTFDVDHEQTGIEIVAGGRSNWIGWLELATEPVDEVATRMTARVIADLGADVLAVIEAESRPTLTRFNRELLADRYGHIMLIDGNDTRGIDVGIMTRQQIEIVDMRSNVDMPDQASADENLFSRDCAEYRCQLSSSVSAWLLVNHFKSQSGGGGPKRARQAQGVREIVDRLLAAGERNIVVMGDLNEGPANPGQPAQNLAPLFDPEALVDVYGLPGFDPGPRPGTFQSCTLRNRFDYILLSKDLAQRFQRGGIERRGLWGDPDTKHPPADWHIYDEITRPEQAASDHAAICVDLDV